MFEARLTQGRIFKALIESIKDLVQDANIDCSEDELSIQAMDSSHVSLVAVTLRSAGFDHFRCDRPISLGFNSANMSKILKCAGNDDVVTLKAEDEGDTLTLMFESEGQDRIADFGTCPQSCSVFFCLWLYFLEECSIWPMPCRWAAATYQMFRMDEAVLVCTYRAGFAPRTTPDKSTHPAPALLQVHNTKVSHHGSTLYAANIFCGWSRCWAFRGTLDLWSIIRDKAFCPCSGLCRVLGSDAEEAHLVPYRFSPRTVLEPHQHVTGHLCVPCVDLAFLPMPMLSSEFFTELTVRTRSINNV